MIRMFFTLLMFPFLTMGQNALNVETHEKTGIQFESGGSWKEILAEAKAQHKYIFMDCYATWCGPCKVMNRDIFPQKQVGEFFNKNFINVAVQMDKTAKDNQGVQSWYGDAKSLSEIYKIEDYPTYLFFSPEGLIVHRVVGAAENAEEFIVSGKNALDSEKQYYSVMAQIQYRLNDSLYLSNALKLALATSDKERAITIANHYLACLKDPLTKKNIELTYVNQLLTNTKDNIYFLFLNNTSKIDSVMDHQGYSANVLKSVIFKEQVKLLSDEKTDRVYWKKMVVNLKSSYPMLGDGLIRLEEKELINRIRSDIRRTLYSEGASAPEWRNIHERLKHNYPDYDLDPIFFYEKAEFYYRNGQWEICQNIAYDLMRRHGKKVNDADINDISWYYVFLHCGNPEILKESLKWMKLSVERSPERSINLDTYANLLYKTGHLQEALQWEKKAIDKTKLEFYLKACLASFDKMKKRQPTWEDNSPVVELSETAD